MIEITIEGSAASLNDLAQERLREQRAESQAASAVAYEKEQRRIKRRTSVLHLFKQDILKGTELPAGATIGTRVSNEHGHQITVRFPGNLSIDAEHLYQADGLLLVSVKTQRWSARVHPCGAQKTFDDFIDAAIWLLGIELEETPEPPKRPQKRAGRPSTIASLIGRKVKDVAHVADCVTIVSDDGLVLDFESDADLKITIRCFCGSPVEVDRPGSYPHLYCPMCGAGWDSVTRFLEWKAGGGKAVILARGGPPTVAEKPAMLALLDVAYRAWFMIQALGSSAIEVELRRQLARFRCTCGAFPVEGSEHGYWCVRCCGVEWDSWEDFVEWRGKQ